jgi:hypothetical protein
MFPREKHPVIRVAGVEVASGSTPFAFWGKKTIQRRRREIGKPRAAPGAALGQHKKRGLALKVRDNCGPYTPVLNQVEVGWHY